MTHNFVFLKACIFPRHDTIFFPIDVKKSFKFHSRVNGQKYCTRVPILLLVASIQFFLLLPTCNRFVQWVQFHLVVLENVPCLCK